jgi:hypothetical protein
MFIFKQKFTREKGAQREKFGTGRLPGPLRRKVIYDFIINPPTDIDAAEILLCYWLDFGEVR